MRRQRITNLFGDIDSFPQLREYLRMIYQNLSSRLGGMHVFREPPTEQTAVFEIVYPNRHLPRVEKVQALSIVSHATARYIA